MSVRPDPFEPYAATDAACQAYLDASSRAKDLAEAYYRRRQVIRKVPIDSPQHARLQAEINALDKERWEVGRSAIRLEAHWKRLVADTARETIASWATYYKTEDPAERDHVRQQLSQLPSLDWAYTLEDNFDSSAQNAEERAARGAALLFRPIIEQVRYDPANRQINIRRIATDEMPG